MRHWQRTAGWHSCQSVQQEGTTRSAGRRVVLALGDTTPSRTGAALRARSSCATLRPANERILERIAQQPDGLPFLVSLRKDLLAGMSSSATSARGDGATDSAVVVADGERERWRSLDASLRRLLSVWFDSGLLRLERLSWDATPPALLEKLMRYERVHPFADWNDLRARLTGPGKRMFALLHPRMQGEPLVFVHVALLSRLPTRLTDVLPDTSPPSDGEGAASGARERARARDELPSEAAAEARRVAVFYSISSPFAGLRGVPIGGLLIKQVLDNLSAAAPGLSSFVTLSPVPGFRAWLEARIARRRADQAAVDPPEGVALARLEAAVARLGVDVWDPFERVAALDDGGVRDALVSLCARYLCLAKQRQRALDSVAAFHLRNGASLVQVHWRANTSSRGLGESAGIMVSYQYVPDEIEQRHSAYVTSGEISADPAVWTLANQ